MMRSLWTAASGMTSQQQNIDTISNNLSNVNTTAFKRERLEFKSLLYQTMERANLDPANSIARPVNLQVGLGTRTVATARDFSIGSLIATEQPLDLAINGSGFFIVGLDNDGETVAYTRDGSFKLSIDDDGASIVTSDGYYLLDTEGERITLPENLTINNLNISSDGQLSYIDEEGEVEELGIQIGMVQFPNVQGLEAIGNNLFVPTVASGEQILEIEGEVIASDIIRGFLESSNVQVAEEMINLIVAQRAYELASKSITTSDDMLQLANNMKR